MIKSREEELNTKRKEFEELQHNLEVLQYKYNYEKENNNALINILMKNNMRIEGLKSRKEKLMKEKELYENGFDSTNVFKENNIDKLKKRVDALCNINEESEDMINVKKINIKSIESKIECLISKCKEIEKEISNVNNNTITL